VWLEGEREEVAAPGVVSLDLAGHVLVPHRAHAHAAHAHTSTRRLSVTFGSKVRRIWLRLNLINRCIKIMVEALTPAVRPCGIPCTRSPARAAPPSHHRPRLPLPHCTHQFIPTN
jgi:hypothetical protein